MFRGLRQKRKQQLDGVSWSFQLIAYRATKHISLLGTSKSGHIFLEPGKPASTVLISGAPFVPPPVVFLWNPPTKNTKRATPKRSAQWVLWETGPQAYRCAKCDFDALGPRERRGRLRRWHCYRNASLQPGLEAREVFSPFHLVGKRRLHFCLLWLSG